MPAINYGTQVHDQNGELVVKNHTVLVPKMEFRLALISKPAHLGIGTHELALGEVHTSRS